MGWTRGLEPRREPARPQRVKGSRYSGTRTGRELEFFIREYLAPEPLACLYRGKLDEFAANEPDQSRAFKTDAN
jgi:hypothetical protein